MASCSAIVSDLREMKRAIDSPNCGVVAEGAFGPDGVFVAETILAKHDERYMPPELAKKDGKVEHRTETLEQ